MVLFNPKYKEKKSTWDTHYQFSIQTLQGHPGKYKLANRNCRLEFGCTPRYMSKWVKKLYASLEILLRNWLAGSKTVVSISRDATATDSFLSLFRSGESSYINKRQVAPGHFAERTCEGEPLWPLFAKWGCSCRLMGKACLVARICTENVQSLCHFDFQVGKSRATGGLVCNLPHPRVNKTKPHTLTTRKSDLVSVKKRRLAFFLTLGRKPDLNT